jgi:hypothetical protein
MLFRHEQKAPDHTQRTGGNACKKDKPEIEQPIDPKIPEMPQENPDELPDEVPPEENK